jgi:hypothetical protein
MRKKSVWGAMGAAMIAVTAQELNQYRLHRLMKVIFIVLLIATFVFSWVFIFAPVNSQGFFKIAFPEDPIYNSPRTAHFWIGDEETKKCRTATPNARHCLVTTSIEFKINSIDYINGTGPEIVERYKTYVEQPVSQSESYAYAALATAVVGLLVFLFYRYVVLYVAFGNRPSG